MKLLQILTEMPRRGWSQKDAIRYFVEMVDDWILDGEAEMDPNWKRVIKNIKFKKELAEGLSEADEEYFGSHEEEIVEARMEVFRNMIKKYKLGEWVGW